MKEKMRENKYLESIIKFFSNSKRHSNNFLYVMKGFACIYCICYCIVIFRIVRASF